MITQLVFRDLIFFILTAFAFLVTFLVTVGAYKRGNKKDFCFYLFTLILFVGVLTTTPFLEVTSKVSEEQYTKFDFVKKDKQTTLTLKNEKDNKKFMFDNTDVDLDLSTKLIGLGNVTYTTPVTAPDKEKDSTLTVDSRLFWSQKENVFTVTYKRYSTQTVTFLDVLLNKKLKTEKVTDSQVTIEMSGKKIDETKETKKDLDFEYQQ